MGSIVVFGIDGVVGLGLFVLSLILIGLAVRSCIPKRWKTAYLRAIRGPGRGACRVCGAPTLDGYRYCSTEHQIQDHEEEAW